MFPPPRWLMAGVCKKRKAKGMAIPGKEEILTLEESVWDALVEGDAAADSALLADTFLGVYETGFSGKAGHVRQLVDGPTVASYQLSDVRLLVPGDGLALLCYRAEFRRVGGPEPEAMYVSSLWQRTEQGWRNIFSQDTAVGDRAPV